MWYRRRQRRHVRPQRLWALWLLALAMLVNPAVAVIGDAHAALAGVSQHAHDAGEAKSDAVEPAPTSLLFALEHAAHCCGQLTADVPALALPAQRLSARNDLPPPPRLPLSARQASLLRPPIA